MTYILSSLASQLRSVITMSTGYAIALMSTMLMYILLPIILTDLRGETRAGIAIMLMTMCQIFFFGPLAASFSDRYGARQTLYGYALFFMIGACLWLLSGVVSGIGVSIVISIMLLCFAAGYGCKMLEAYVLRVSPARNSGMAFGFLVTFAGLGRFIATLIQPHLVLHSYPRGAWIMVGAMMCFAVFLYWSTDDRTGLHLTDTNDQEVKKNSDHHIAWRQSIAQTLIASYKRAFVHGPIFIRRCRYFPLVPLIVALWEGVFYGSIWFLIPLYLAHHPEYISHGWEIGIYELISVAVAVLCGYLVDKWHTRRILGLGWVMVIIGGGWIIYSPHIETMITAGIIIALANSTLFASGQRILAIHDSDHEDDGAYSQTRQFVLNIGFMIMPLFRGYMHIGAERQFILLSVISTMIAVVGIITMRWLRYRHPRIIKQTAIAGHLPLAKIG